MRVAFDQRDEAVVEQLLVFCAQAPARRRVALHARAQASIQQDVAGLEVAPQTAGMRIDHLLVSPSLRPRVTAVGVDKAVRGLEGSSDHAGVGQVEGLKPKAAASALGRLAGREVAFATGWPEPSRSDSSSYTWPPRKVASLTSTRVQTPLEKASATAAETLLRSRERGTPRRTVATSDSGSPCL